MLDSLVYSFQLHLSKGIQYSTVKPAQVKSFFWAPRPALQQGPRPKNDARPAEEKVFNRFSPPLYQKDQIKARE